MPPPLSTSHICRGIRVTMCHPGPIATGVTGQVRSLYGSQGLLTEVEDQAKVKQRQSPQRVASLVLTAAYHGLDTCWIAQHPVLLLGAENNLNPPSTILCHLMWITISIRSSCWVRHHTPTPFLRRPFVICRGSQSQSLGPSVGHRITKVFLQAHVLE